MWWPDKESDDEEERNNNPENPESDDGDGETGRFTVNDKHDDFQTGRVEILREMSDDDEDDEHHEEAEDLVGPMRKDDIEEHVNDNGEELKRKALVEKDNSRRVSNVVDLSTGVQGGVHAQRALRRSESSTGPINTAVRRRRTFLKAMQRKVPSLKNIHEDEAANEEEMRTSIHGRIMVSTRNISYHGDDDLESQNNEPAQYRMQAIKPSRGLKYLSYLGCAGPTLNLYDDASSGSSSSFVRRYLHWSFRRSFGAFFLSAAAVFFGLTTTFAIGIWAIGIRRPECIGGLVVDGVATSPTFMDAFELSWTTFSTAGYGAIYTGVSSSDDHARRCAGITILVSLEAFVGMIFGSMTCAIMFAKVSRIQSYAQVMFSDPIVVRYGSGLARGDAQDSDTDSASCEIELEKIPCPALEFRLINRMSGTAGGEIIDSTLNIVACIDASQACPTIRRAATRRRRGKKGKKGGPKRPSGPVQRKPASMRDGPTSVPESTPLDQRRADSTASITSLFEAAREAKAKPTQSFEEDPTGHLVPKRIFAKLDVESQDHPFFKRVWVVRHTLDEDSPLLRHHAREMVKLNCGCWPKELNNHEGVRAAISFEQILVSMSGTSNADANSVYAQKVYDFADVNVGYRFVNVLYRDMVDGSLQVDSRLLNDVMEQAGGGGEPLHCELHEEGVREVFAM